MTAPMTDAAKAVLIGLAQAALDLDHAATVAREYGEQDNLLAALGVLTTDVERHLEQVTALVAGARAIVLMATKGGAQ